LSICVNDTVGCFSGILPYSIDDYDFTHGLYERLKVEGGKEQSEALWMERFEEPVVLSKNSRCCTQGIRGIMASNIRLLSAQMA